MLYFFLFERMLCLWIIQGFQISYPMSLEGIFLLMKIFLYVFLIVGLQASLMVSFLMLDIFIIPDHFFRKSYEGFVIL
ncbi:hypothetical protein UN63_12240 [Oceanisphaera arctica]|uniref:Uncharacterized protein n=1 Tax=Oceanisphaera arctica TaxID=641510 RepID=A0A2P5TK94_9GAMM|nr:hypothetical protein UN63_12240 [Oceanisphaera arctica]